MDAYTNLFYGLGQVIYAVSMADGEIQKEEVKKVHEIVVENLDKSSVQFDYTEIIFNILKHDNVTSADEAYKNGMHNIHLGDHLLTEELKAIFTKAVVEVAEAFPPQTGAESKYIVQFCQDLDNIGN